MSKYIIVNADDFGYNAEQTRAIRELYRDGRITSTSLMAVAPGAEDAARIAREEKIPVGVHLTINSDSEAQRWQSRTRGRSLSDDRGLRCSQIQVALHARRREVAVELEAQYAFLIGNGCCVDHADNHCGTLYGINGRRFYWEAYRFCARHDLPYRFPKSPAFIERQLRGRVPGWSTACTAISYRLGSSSGFGSWMTLSPIPSPWNRSGITSTSAAGIWTPWTSALMA